MDSSRPYRPHKKPRICQRCRTHGAEQLSTSEHRGNCPWKDCTCPKCQTIQRENLRHSEYNRRRRAERREKANYSNQAMFMQSHYPTMQAQQPASAHNTPYYVVVPDPSTQAVGGPATNQYASSPMQHSRGHPISQQYFARHPMQAAATHGMYLPQTSPTGVAPQRSAPSFYGGRGHQPPPPVQLGRPYTGSFAGRQGYAGSGHAESTTPLAAKRSHDSLHDDSPPPKRTAMRRTPSTSDSNDVFEQNGHHAGTRSPVEACEPPLHHRLSRVESRGASPALSEDDDENIDEVDDDDAEVTVIVPRTSPPPLQSSQYKRDSQVEQRLPAQSAPAATAEGRSSTASTGATFRSPAAAEASGGLPWSITERGASIQAPNLVELLDLHPGIDHRMAYVYLASCDGSVPRASQALKDIQKTRRLSSSSSNSSACSDSSSSDSSAIEVDDLDSIYRRIVLQSKYGFRLGRPGQATEKVNDVFVSPDLSPAQSTQQQRSPQSLNRARRRASRRCWKCKSWFSVAQTNNTLLCSRHQQAP